MPLDPIKPAQQAKIPAGTALLEGGKPANLLCIVHQGKVSSINKFDQKGARQMYAIGPNSNPGFAPMLLGTPYLVGYRTITDCVVSSFPVKGPFTKLIMGKLNVGLMAARSLAQEVIASQQMVQRLTSLASSLEKTQDNLAIVFARCNPNQFEESSSNGGEVIDPVLSRARVAFSAYKDNGGELPDPITQAWLQGDYRNIYNKTYEFTSQFDTEEFQFLRNLLALPVNIQGAMYKANLRILEGLCRKLGRVLQNNIHEIYQLQELVDQSLEALVSGDYSYAEKYYMLSDLLDSEFSQVPLEEFHHVARFLSTAANTYLKNYKDLQGINFPAVAPGLQKLSEFLTSNNEVKKMQAAEKQVQSVSGDSESIRKELHGSVGKIMSFLKLPAEDHKKITGLLKQLKAENNPLDTGGDPRKIRRGINTIFWKAYEAAMYKFLENRGNVPRYIKMMLNYAYFDEEFLDEEHLVYLYNAEDNSRARYNIHSATDWLQSIHAGENSPSVDEMGQTYFERIKLEFKERGFKRERDVPDDVNTPERRLHQEIFGFLDINVRLTTGHPTTAFCILTRNQIVIPLQRALITNEKLSDTIDKLLSVDFSAYHREIILNDDERNIIKEFIMIQVIPDYIVVPSIGSKMMMWQDVAGRSKSSRGRITIPVFATADIYTMLLEATAAFRWELTKTIMGADWNNVAESSITADYTDYVQFFKKNRELSQDQKEKLSNEFKRFRNDRDRFANDYINWMKYEAEGVLKLNKVCRNIMYKHVSFEKKLRDELSNQPAYGEIHNRFRNIRNRKLKELDVRYRKYNENLPVELKNNLQFWGV